MTALEKLKCLIEMQCQNKKVRIKTTDHAVYRCRLLGQCEDSDAWAYEFYSPDFSTKFFALNCDSISEIEEISEDEWQAACEYPMQFSLLHSERLINF